MRPSLSLLLILSSAARAAPPEAPSMQLTPPPNHPFVHGPSTTDSAALVRWLEAQGDAVVKLPVLVQLATPPTTVKGGRVLTQGKEALEVRLSDAALGISLADRARQACPGAAACPLWLDGRWRKDHFAVTRTRGRVLEEGPYFVELEQPEAKPAVVALVDQLASDAKDAKQSAARALVAAGVDAIPVLIASLDDGRTFEVRDVANRMNLPANSQVAPHLATVNVGARCLELLHEVITPAPSVPVKNVKVFSLQVLRVKDWRAFWNARKTKTLAQLHEELRPLVNDYWVQHGTTQLVP